MSSGPILECFGRVEPVCASQPDCCLSAALWVTPSIHLHQYTNISYFSGLRELGLYCSCNVLQFHVSSYVCISLRNSWVIDTKGWITSSVNIALSRSGGSGMLSASFNHLQWYADTHFYSGPGLARAMNSASNSAWPRTARLKHNIFSSHTLSAG